MQRHTGIGYLFSLLVVVSQVTVPVGTVDTVR